jgi:ABC-2 type transport system ATP-binding protein
MNVLEVKNATKRYGEILAIDNISFSIKRGEIFGLLGPNGAGKTTTIKIISGITKPTSGDVLIDGISVIKHPEQTKRKIGWMSAESILDDDLTAMENIEVQAKLNGVKEWKEEAENLLKYFEIYEFKDKKTSTFSTGMRKKLEIAIALINNPSIILLDEPTIGLDVNTRSVLWKLIRKINRERRVTVLLTTHYMEEAQELCDRIAIINHGKIIAIDSPEELIRKYGINTIEVKLRKKINIKGFEILSASQDSTNLIIKSYSPEEDLLKLIRKYGRYIESFKISRATLDSAFLHLTGEFLSEEKYDQKQIVRLIKGL